MKKSDKLELLRFLVLLCKFIKYLRRNGFVRH